MKKKEHEKLLQKTILCGMVCQIDNIFSLYAKGDHANGNQFLLNLQDQIKELINKID